MTLMQEFAFRFIVCVFLVTELPQGIMAVLSGMFSEEFRHYVYNRQSISHGFNIINKYRRISK